MCLYFFTLWPCCMCVIHDASCTSSLCDRVVCVWFMTHHVLLHSVTVLLVCDSWRIMYFFTLWPCCICVFQERIMYFPTWIDLKGADAVPETVHHCVSSAVVIFWHLIYATVIHALSTPYWKNTLGDFIFDLKDTPPYHLDILVICNLKCMHLISFCKDDLTM